MFNVCEYKVMKTIEKEKQEIDSHLMSQKMIKNKDDDVSFDSWKPISLGGLKKGAKDWYSKDYQNEVSEVFDLVNYSDFH